MRRRSIVAACVCLGVSVAVICMVDSNVRRHEREARPSYKPSENREQAVASRTGHA